MQDQEVVIHDTDLMTLRSSLLGESDAVTTIPLLQQYPVSPTRSHAQLLLMENQKIVSVADWRCAVPCSGNAT